MVKLCLYGHLKATCVQRILILLEELELKYSFRNVDIFNGEHKLDKYLEMNPFGKVPVIKYGDKTIFESRTILRYISKNNRAINDLYGDIITDQWLEVESNSFNPYVSKVVYEKIFKKMMGKGEADGEVIKQSIEALENVLDVYENHLKDNKYLGGNEYTIADISHIPYAYLFIKSGFKDVFRSRPHVYSWLKKIMKRPAVRRVLDGRIEPEPEPVTDQEVEEKGNDEADVETYSKTRSINEDSE